MRQSLLLSAALLLAVTACGPKPASTGGSTASAPSSGQKPGRVELSAVPQASLIKAQAGKTARYDNALAAAYAPADQNNYTAFSEYGWRPAVTDPKSEVFLKYGPMPAGWWVYSAPYWVVWNLKNGKPGP